MKRCLAAAMVVVLVGPFHAVIGQTELTLDHVDGAYATGQIPANTPVTFYIRATFITGDGGTVSGFNNGFRVYSPDGASWQPITYDSASLEWWRIYSGGFFFSPYGITGSGADTLGVGGFGLFGTTGMADPFDEVVWWISTQLDESQIGKTLCLDSSWYPPGGVWLWSTIPSGSIPPDWDGPHCFSIVPACLCGDVDGSGEGPNVADLTRMIAYLFEGGPAPDCIPGAKQ